ncbi:zinc finger protein 1035 isoform X2 [Phycodurus eques]|uniref:zinc finger protein 1035 isoform X2 n=1 Tax=Phycodurus eques TaxID=693459 RepID=UPI002ACEDC68|nr:zinc finger protein 1035 isoform X2 [Phycodurus eques]XP_061531016.1 zinc finger protein 1035 isoform X2 [Phycodurus eques]XP_061531017.1 zinc finger protein 1035 isoform X2 [Phycodurus eques]
MMLGLQGNLPPSSKMYRCVACSATFSGLAALLVHQATHANMLPKVIASPSTQPDMSTQGALTANLKSTNPSASSDGASPSFYICDCGEEFHNFCLMLEHKQSHDSQLKSLQLTDGKVLSSAVGSTDDSPNLIVKLRPSVAKTDSVQSCPSTSGSPPFKIELEALGRLEERKVVSSTPLEQCCPSTSDSPPVKLELEAIERPEDSEVVPSTPLEQCKTPEEINGELDKTSATTEPMPETERDSQSVHSSDNEERLTRNNKLMKMLASAYMKHASVSPSPKDSNYIVTPKQEAVPVDITPVKEFEEPPVNDLSVAKLKRLLAKPGVKTKAPTISRIIDSSRKKIVSLTKVLSPVVVLETRQKLRDPSNNALFGRYQCGRCRRTFPNSDRLTEHHFLHKKERIKCCRRCKQLIIGKLPFTDNHVCIPSMKKPEHLPSALPLVQKMMPFHSFNNMKKSFYCPVCKHNYARRYNLKKHKCHGPKASPPHTHPSADRLLVLRSSNKALAYRDGQGEHEIGSVSVYTEAPRVKVEVTSTTPEQSEMSDFSWCGFAKSFPPFLSKSSMMDTHKHGPSSVMENNCSDVASVHNESSNEGQWTMPLDDDTELLSSQNAANDGEMESESDLSYFVRDGVKRYPCPRCQKTYSRPSTLARHLRLCGFRPRGPVPVSHSASYSGVSQNSSTKPMFACFVCGRNFNRKDNMMVHRRRCQMQRTETKEPLQHNLPGGAKGIADNDANNWGIMSLPSVLPRRVTCECGVGFTSPRLLLEHLQKHAQESYTCPTCGETVNSWADYEVHLQIHMHPHHQLLTGLQTQRSQPLVLRIQHQPLQQQPQHHQQPPPPPVHKPSQKELVPERSNGDKKQRVICTRCGNTFATRCSLRRHLSWDRCKGGRPQNAPKLYRCSRCSSEFPNMVSLLFHQRSGACKPTIKPVRCPVCLRWFGTVDGLQKHLLTHKQSESHRCDICQCSYPSLKSLKTHRRRVHNVMVAELLA